MKNLFEYKSGDILQQLFWELIGYNNQYKSQKVWEDKNNSDMYIEITPHSTVRETHQNFSIGISGSGHFIFEFDTEEHSYIITYRGMRVISAQRVALVEKLLSIFKKEVSNITWMYGVNIKEVNTAIQELGKMNLEDEE